MKQHKELSRILGRDCSTITRWLQRYRLGGLEKLLEVKAATGAIAKIQGQMLQSLVEKLQCPQEFSSYGQIVKWLEQEFNVQVKYKTVYRLVRYKLKATLKVQRLVSIEQDEQAVSLFKKRFPSPY
ncbi:MAG: helix-turn-helix domain-containing protein [Rhizonema sp. PD38]|nr:helix-turn-helix domain-containing protein [Rhizonema sp. PD38]